MNKSNFIHAVAALAIQVALGAAAFYLGVTYACWVSGALACGAFIGIEWMQQINMNLLREYRPWPDALSVRDVLRGFVWRSPDRYGDCGLPLVACSLLAYFWR